MLLRIAEREGSAAVERTEARSVLRKVKKNQLNTPNRYEYNDVYASHGD